ncbi:MAG: metallophosphoesterase [Deltaproteobacteria bacterium]|nr:metallophosphoesterase [Deltaproteobacteria bacterium]
MPPSPTVLWPAPCWPAVLEPGEHRLELLVAHDGVDREALAAWAAGLALTAAGTRPMPLSVESVDALEAPAGDARIGQAVAGLGLRRVACLVADAAGAPPPVPPARARVFDLVRQGGLLRPRCIARHARAEPLRLGFASDLHHAGLWDEVHADLRRFAPDLAEAALYPNLQVRRLVADANARAARGELDALVLGGDLVDHVYRVSHEGRRGAAADTNLPGLLDALAALEVPCFAIPGNHDHRLHPWRPRAYGLAEIGVPWPRLRALLRAAGRWDPWPLRRRDLDALRTHEPGGRDGLAHHLALLAPALDFTLCFGGLRLVFLSTGRDALCRWRGIERGRRRLLLRSLRSSWEHPDSEGLREEQFGSLVQALDAGRGGAAVFLHAPLLHPRGPVEQVLPRLDPGPPDGPAGRTRFERTLFASGLRRGVFFRNAAPFLRALGAARGPLAVFSGHVHRAHAWRWDPRRGDARSCRWPVVGEPGVLFANAPAVALGPSGEGGEGDERPGYLVATFADGALHRLERAPLTGAAD